MAKVKRTYSLDEKVAAQIEEYATVFGVTASAFVSIMVSQIGQVLTLAAKDEEKHDSRVQGDI